MDKKMPSLQHKQYLDHINIRNTIWDILTSDVISMEEATFLLKMQATHSSIAEIIKQEIQLWNWPNQMVLDL